MSARPATPDDAAEVIRLAALMFTDIGSDASLPEWQEAAARHVCDRLGHDAAVFVVDNPTYPGQLVAVAAGTITTRLPSPVNPSGRVGYVQWVSTEPEARRQGHAAAVMDALLGWYAAEGVRSVELHATEMGEPLYRRIGFGDPPYRALRRRTAQ